MGAMGASGGANATLINSFLRNGQAQLYRLQDWKHLQDYDEETTGIGQNLYDYPTSGVMGTAGCSRDKRILRVETTIGGQYMCLGEGISTEHWTNMETRGSPQRYERYAQIMIYPKSEAAYTLRFWFVADLGRFTQDGDRATLDDEMILLHALANAKAHYRQPDAKTYEGQLNALLGSLRTQSFSSNGVYRREPQAEVERRPLLVGRDI
jgi:hypothetical protein